MFVPTSYLDRSKGGVKARWVDPLMDLEQANPKGSEAPELSTELPETELELEYIYGCPSPSFGCLIGLSPRRQHCVLIHSPHPQITAQTRTRATS